MSEADSPDRELQALRQELVSSSPALAQKRVFSRLERSIPALAAAASPPTGVTVTNAPLRGSSFAGAAKLSLLGTFALGGAVGAVTVATLQPAPETRIVYVERPERAPAPVEAPAPAERGADPSRRSNAPASEMPAAKSAPARRAPQVLPPGAPAVVEATPPELTESADLGEQQALLDQARAALGKGEGSGALELLKTHSSRFPQSVLTEEREALRVKSLVKAGHAADARASLEAFASQFPRSPLLPSLRATTANAVTETAR